MKKMEKRGLKRSLSPPSPAAFDPSLHWISDSIESTMREHEHWQSRAAFNPSLHWISCAIGSRKRECDHLMSRAGFESFGEEGPCESEKKNRNEKIWLRKKKMEEADETVLRLGIHQTKGRSMDIDHKCAIKSVTVVEWKKKQKNMG